MPKTSLSICITQSHMPMYVCCTCECKQGTKGALESVGGGIDKGKNRQKNRNCEGREQCISDGKREHLPQPVGPSKRMLLLSNNTDGT